MIATKLLGCLIQLIAFASASYYDAAEARWNLNANKNAATPLDYDIPPWHSGFKYHESPRNWRFPFYSFFLDRFVNGDPTNDDANGTLWEQDPYQTQLRNGGDVRGLMDSLDYLEGLGIKGLYIAGSPMINLPWAADAYSPLDHTLLDHHFGDVQDWRDCIEAIHARGMYVILDNTMSTLSNFFSFEGYYNSSAPWSFTEHVMQYTSGRKYRDYYHSNDFEDVCSYPYPRFWDQSGFEVHDNATDQMIGCMDSEFDQYGDVGAFGVYPEWQKQLSKFDGVQDRLREWRPQVLDKINHFSCMIIRALDIDGFRIDKAMQVTVDAQGNFSSFQRACAASVGKKNFFIPGEIVNGNADGSIYLGRGKEASMLVQNTTKAMLGPITGNSSAYIRPEGHQALDASAFHYSTYRALMRFLGLDGNLLAFYDAPINFQDQWWTFVQTNDLINANTGEFDPRHMYGVSNQDVLRWPGLANGTERQLLGDFIITLLMPGIPLVSWGEEQAFYTLDSTAANYVYGRQPMSSSLAWQMHGCYKVGDYNLRDAPFNKSLVACQDDSVSLDHRDPSHAVYGTLKHMFELRQRYPVLQDGWNLREMSRQTFEYELPGSFGVPTVTGLWSVLRGRIEGVQDFSEDGMFGNQAVWLLYSNLNTSTVYESDCADVNATISPFDAGETVKNLFYPFDEWTLENSSVSLGIEGSSRPNGCLPRLNMTMYGWKAFVPIEKWSAPPPVIVNISPGHDTRILSVHPQGEPARINVEVQFSQEMDCDSFKEGVSINSTTDFHRQAVLDVDSIQCLTTDPQMISYHYGPSPAIWRATMAIDNVFDGVHIINIKNISSQTGDSTNSNDHFTFRLGSLDNPMVFPKIANYSTSLLYSNKDKQDDGQTKTESKFIVNHKAAGADKWRFSLSFGAVWSRWYEYTPGNFTIPLSDIEHQNRGSWAGDHIQVQYWSAATGSSNHIVQGDLVGQSHAPRRFPQMSVDGEFNHFGFDSGVPNSMSQMDSGMWTFDLLTELPSNFQLNVWGMADNGRPDTGYIMGDVDHDGVLDRISPVSLQQNIINITNFGPPAPALAWRILFNDADFRYYIVPSGSRYLQAALWSLFAVIPVLMAAIAVWCYVMFFYDVKFNRVGLVAKKSVRPFHTLARAIRRNHLNEKDGIQESSAGSETIIPDACDTIDRMATGMGPAANRRTVLIATMEYEITDWAIKIKIGGLGVMAQLMGKNLQHQNLIWVVPCAGGIDYPHDQVAAPIDVIILGRTYAVQVQYHQLKNITYVLLDAPIFRRQTAKEPYPARMDDLDSAIYYSAWNQCIAEAMNRFPIDLYHINDYHGTLAPLYHLPKTIPCCLSLHNAEFQGLWPMRDPGEVEEICSVFNLSPTVVQCYVQFGEVFNLLHAGASILRIHQRGFGAVGVSKKYGKRSWARYPIFWGLKRIGALPNPDPSDVAAWDKQIVNIKQIEVDEVFERQRITDKRSAQEWAGLIQRPDADLFVFVGRWSMQKGIDLIADVFPAILGQHQQVQLLCIGPTIDLHGKFAALKLQKMMQKYPGRVYSKPEFTALPPFIFSGAEFALIPSRDEPFGLVAVEFGRKGALGVGSRVGGLGQMPGWWYTIESPSTRHQLDQFKMAIATALRSDLKTRAVMRARSAKQRFPVVQWKEDLEILQATSIAIHRKRMENVSNRQMGLAGNRDSYAGRPNSVRLASKHQWNTPESSLAVTRAHSPTPLETMHSQPSMAMATSEHHREETIAMQSRQANSHHQPAHHDNTMSEESNDRGFADGAKNDDEHIDMEDLDQAEYDTGSYCPDVVFAFRDDQEMDEALAITDPRTATPNIPGSSAALSNPDHPSAAPSGSVPGQHPSAATASPSPAPKVRAGRKPHRQIMTPLFTDPTGLYYRAFERRLENLNGKNSEASLCIEEYLERSEKQWFGRLHDAKMSRSSVHAVSGSSTPAVSIHGGDEAEETVAQFLLPAHYKPPSGLRRIALYKIGDWPVYSFLLAMGQILAANSYQITLISGQVGQTANQLYIIASVYLAATLIWWVLFRRLALVWCLSLPWVFYGLAFWLIACAPYGRTIPIRGAIQLAASTMYAVASASGSIFFAQNFGSLGSAAVKEWAFRACAIQGTQQLYVVGLWAWGAKLASVTATGADNNLGTTMTAIGVPIAVFLWVIGAVIFFGLPAFYRQKPGAVPDFYSSIFRRRITVWFLVAVFVQNIFLSAPYGRNWTYLWSSKYAPGWAIVLLVLFFFIVVWTLILWCFGHLSKTHSWIIPIFAVGLGSPRWCQILWATSSIGQYLPWAGGPIASALLGRGLWLWLGVLDSVQGIGFGMILLQTMVRFHCTFALMSGQVVGAIATIIARADGLNSDGPGSTFPSFVGGWSDGLSQPWFWVCLILQLGISVGFFLFFRKEQLAKP